MTVLDLENSLNATTHHWSASVTVSDQSNPVTRRVVLDSFLGELETAEIERNEEFHATVLARLGQDPRSAFIDSDELLGD